MNQDIKLSSDNPQATAQRLGNAIRGSQVAHDLFDDGFCRFLGINRTDGRCLDIIARHGRLTAGQLAGEAGLTTGAVTTALDRLELAGYVQRLRDPGDRRRIWIEQTPLSQDIGTRVFSHYDQIAPRLAQSFTPDQIDAILRFLDFSTRIERDHAALMARHTDTRMTGPTARLARAEAYERDAHALTASLIAAEADKGRG